MAISNLTGQKTYQSFRNLMQISSSGQVYDGLGNLVTFLQLTSSFASGSTSGGTGAGFPFSGSAVITGSLLVSSSLTVTGSLRVQGSITGSLFGTSSYATQALSSSFALNAPNYLPLQGGVMSGEISAPLLTVSNGAYGPIRLVDDYVAGEAGLIAADDTAIAIIYQDGTYRYGGAVGSEPLQISGSTIKIYDKLENGSGNITLGLRSHAEGNSTIASGDETHAEGLATVASGDYSHAEGSSTVTGYRTEPLIDSYTQTISPPIIGASSKIVFSFNGNYTQYYQLVLMAIHYRVFYL